MIDYHIHSDNNGHEVLTKLKSLRMWISKAMLNSSLLDNSYRIKYLIMNQSKAKYLSLEVGKICITCLQVEYNELFQALRSYYQK
jgi:hypothetical protein